MRPMRPHRNPVSRTACKAQYAARHKARKAALRAQKKARPAAAGE